MALPSSPQGWEMVKEHVQVLLLKELLRQRFEKQPTPSFPDLLERLPLLSVQQPEASFQWRARSQEAPQLSLEVVWPLNTPKKPPSKPLASTTQPSERPTAKLTLLRHSLAALAVLSFRPRLLA